MSLSLRAFQDGFAAAVASPGRAPGLPTQIGLLAGQPAFAVYRNTVMKGWIDALEANFPAVFRLVGEEWFRAAASVYARRHPPRRPMMSLYGEDFDTFLAGFEPAGELPFLPPVARMDRLWSEAASSANAPMLTPDALAAAGPLAADRSVAALHPSARFDWFETSAPTIWLDARGYTLEADELDYEERGEGLFLVRPRETVHALKLTRGAHLFLNACAARRTLEAAASEALAAEPSLDLTSLIAELLGIGAFTSIRLAEEFHS